MLDVEVRERAGTNRISRRKTYSLHLQNGSFLEGGWDNAYYTREWNCPPNGPPAEGIQVIIMPPNQSEPGGAGEFGVAASMAAVANAYARATGTVPTGFPINLGAGLRHPAD